MPPSINTTRRFVPDVHWTKLSAEADLKQLGAPEQCMTCAHVRVVQTYFLHVPMRHVHVHYISSQGSCRKPGNLWCMPGGKTRKRMHAIMSQTSSRTCHLRNFETTGAANEMFRGGSSMTQRKNHRPRCKVVGVTTIARSLLAELC